MRATWGIRASRADDQAPEPRPPPRALGATARRRAGAARIGSGRRAGLRSAAGGLSIIRSRLRRSALAAWASRPRAAWGPTGGLCAAGVLSATGGLSAAAGGVFPAIGGFAAGELASPRLGVLSPANGGWRPRGGSWRFLGGTTGGLPGGGAGRLAAFRQSAVSLLFSPRSAQSAPLRVLSASQRLVDCPEAALYP